ncbi:MAG: cytochrome c oxidase subunit [Thermoleophilaceae bacterium]|nr:cytochrome c oxidase subunit [Thermoleophilaceae bacterium]
MGGGALTATVAAPPGAASLPATTDHKRLARAIAVCALGFFLAGGVMALVMRLELAAPGMQVVSKGDYAALFSMHGSTMIFLFITPMALAAGLYLVPLQIGAAELALPRVALAGFWLYLGGGLMTYAGFFTDTGPNQSGWTAFTPLSDSPFSPGPGMDFWVLGVALVTLGQILWGIALLATIARRRAPGMTMLRMPPFTWGVLVACLLVVFAFPALVVAMVLLYIDRAASGGVFDGTVGAVDYQHLFWFYGHPVVYVMFFPFIAAVLEVIATFSRKRVFGYRTMVASLLLFTALSMSVWAHHMFTTSQVANKYFALMSTALVVPAGIEYFSMIATMVGGSILLRTPMLFALGFVVHFLVGGLSGIFVASPPLDYHVHDSYVVVAHFHYTIFGGSVFGLFAAAYYWMPKLTGVLLGERLGKVHFWLTVIGMNVTFLPMFWVGYHGMARRIPDYPARTGWETANTIETVGSFVIALSVVVFLANLVISLRARVPAGPDPWEGHTLEWATSSPPPRHNFDELPVIRSHAPLLDLRLQRAGARA